MPITERTRARPSASITTPGLSRHLVFFFPARDPGQTGNKPDTEAGTPAAGTSSSSAPAADPLDVSPVYDLIKQYVKSLFDIVEKGKPEYSKNRRNTLKNLKAALKQRTNFGLNCGRFLGLRVRAIIVLYAEHFTVTFLVDNDHSSEEPSAFPSRAIESIKDLANYLITALARKQPGPARPNSIELSSSYSFTEVPENNRNEAYLNDIIYREFWVAFDATFRNNDSIVSIGDRALQSDIRGLLLTAPGSCGSLPDPNIFAEIQRSTPPVVASTVYKPRMPSIKSYLRRENLFFSETLGVGKSYHFITREQPQMQWDSNHVLCFVNDETCLYGSCLSYQDKTEDMIYDKSYDYIRYFIISDGSNDQTLGRLVRRMHVLAELRIMALIERARITGLNDSIRTIGNALSEIIDNMTGRYINGVKQPETLDVGRLSAIVDAYNDLGKQRTFQDATRINDKDKHKVVLVGKKPISYERCFGGLVYRLNRSKYYYDSFTERLGDLRLKDVKSAQSYDRFVLRNYDQQIRSIESIRDRYTLLGSRIDRAVTLAHGLQQRKFAQYAAFLAILIASIPTFTAINVMVANIFPSPACRGAIIAFAIIALVAGVSLANDSFIEFLKRRGLYVLLTPDVARKQPILQRLRAFVLRNAGSAPRPGGQRSPEKTD
mgnify:CR=1 FL=1